MYLQFVLSVLFAYTYESSDVHRIWGWKLVACVTFLIIQNDPTDDYPSLSRNFLYTWLLFVWPEMRLQRVAIVQGDGDASKTVVPIHNSPLPPSPIDSDDEASTVESSLSDANCFFWHIQLPLRVISAYQGQECSSSSLD